MNWEIFSIGDARYLTTVLNAVAIMTGGADFKTIASIGFLLGLILTGFQGLMGGAREFKLQTFVVSLVVYFCMFGPRVTVSITDVYSDQVYQVDNTPLGLAAFGTITSGITTTITKQIEGTFALPTMFEGGFVGSLRTLLGGRSLRTLSPKASTNGNPTGWPYQDSLENSISNYVRDCIQVAIKRGVINEKQLLSAPDMWAVMQFPSDVFGTVLPLYPPQGDNISSDGYEATCTRAYQDISNRFNDTNFQQAFEQQAAVIFGKNPQLKIQAALNTFGQGTFTSITGDAQAFMMNNVLHYLYERGWRESLAAEGRAEEALMISTAASQRDIQWAGESNMFVQVARPMIAFFEGLVYSLAPFMAFLIGFGSFGLTMVAKYLLLGLWVQIMPPVMALVNLYFNFAAQDEFKAVIDAGTEITSVYGMMEMYPSLNRWIGMAGLLGASVPAISMMLLYGSSVAATSMAGRLQGGDHLNEKIAAPDAFQPAAAVSARSSMESDVFKGTNTSIAPQLLSGAGAASTMKALHESSIGAQESANASLGSSVTGHYASQFSSKQSFEELRELGASIRSSKESGLSSLSSRADRIAEEYGNEKTDRSLLTGMLAVSGSAGGGLDAGVGSQGLGKALGLTSKMGASLSASGQVQGQTSDQRQMSDAETLKLVNSEGRDVGRDERVSAALGRELTQKMSLRSKDSQERALTEGAESKFDEQYRASLAATRAVREAESSEQTWQLAQNVSGEVLAAEVGKTPSAMKAMNSILNNSDPYLNDYTLRSEYDKQYERIRPNVDNQNTAKAAAFFNAMSNVGGQGSPEQIANRTAVMAQVMGSAGFATRKDTTLDNSELWRSAPSAEGIRQQVSEKLDGYRGMSSSAEGTAERVGDRLDSDIQRVRSGTSEAADLTRTTTSGFNTESRGQVEGEYRGNRTAHSDDAYIRERDQYLAKGQLNEQPLSLDVFKQMREIESLSGRVVPDWMRQGYDGEKPSAAGYSGDLREVKNHLTDYAQNTLEMPRPLAEGYALGMTMQLDEGLRNGSLGIPLGNSYHAPVFGDRDVQSAKQFYKNAMSDDGRGNFSDRDSKGNSRDEQFAERSFEDILKVGTSGEAGLRTVNDVREIVDLRMQRNSDGYDPTEGEYNPTVNIDKWKDKDGKLVYVPNMNVNVPLH